MFLGLQQGYDAPFHPLATGTSVSPPTSRVHQQKPPHRIERRSHAFSIAARETVRSSNPLLLFFRWLRAGGSRSFTAVPPRFCASSAHAFIILHLPSHTTDDLPSCPLLSSNPCDCPDNSSALSRTLLPSFCARPRPNLDDLPTHRGSTCPAFHPVALVSCPNRTMIIFHVQSRNRASCSWRTHGEVREN